MGSIENSLVRQFGSWRRGTKWHLVGLLGATLLAAGMYFFVERVWAPPEGTHLSDLYSRWYGSRELLLHGRDPYGAAVTREVQIWAYGHPVDAEHPEGTRDQDRFAYPAYVAFILAPTVRLPFAEVQNIFRGLLPLLAVVTIFFWIFMLRWWCGLPVLGIAVLLSFGSFPMLESIYLQQPVLLSALFLAGAGAALSAEWLGVAGILLALATIKPQLVAPLSLWLAAWAGCDWKARGKLVWGFVLTMIALAGGAEILLPGWIGRFLAGAASYQSYTGGASILTLLFTKFGGAGLQAMLLVALGLVAWQLRHEHAGSLRFHFVFCAVLVTTLVVIPTIYPTGQVMLLPAIYFLQQNFAHFWGLGRAARLAYVAACSLIGWQWVGSLAFLVAHWLVPISTIRRWWLIPLDTSFLVPLALLVLFAIWAPSMLVRNETESVG